MIHFCGNTFRGKKRGVSYRDVLVCGGPTFGTEIFCESFSKKLEFSKHFMICGRIRFCNVPTQIEQLLTPSLHDEILADSIIIKILVDSTSVKSASKDIY